MRDKTEQILQAALHVFANKGYKESTTQEIANEAEVAEITIFRKFKSKQNLFVSTIQSIVMSKFDKKLLVYAEQESTEQFLIDVLHDRLTAISKNHIIIKTLISESLMGNLEEKIDMPKLMFNTINKALEFHFSTKGKNVDIEQLARMLSGILVSHIVWPPTVPYHKLIEDKKIAMAREYISALRHFWK